MGATQKHDRRHKLTLTLHPTTARADSTSEKHYLSLELGAMLPAPVKARVVVKGGL